MQKKSLPTNNALLIQLYIDGGSRRCVGEHFGVEGVCCVVSLCCKLCIISSCHSMPLKVAYYYTPALHHSEFRAAHQWSWKWTFVIRFRLKKGGGVQFTVIDESASSMGFIWYVQKPQYIFIYVSIPSTSSMHTLSLRGNTYANFISKTVFSKVFSHVHFSSKGGWT